MENSTVIEVDCEVSLRSLSQQPPVTYVKCDRLQPRTEPVTKDLSPARGTARPCRLISFDLFKNVFYIPWRVNDNFELGALLLQSRAYLRGIGPWPSPPF